MLFCHICHFEYFYNLNFSFLELTVGLEGLSFGFSLTCFGIKGNLIIIDCAIASEMLLVQQKSAMQSLAQMNVKYFGSTNNGSKVSVNKSSSCWGKNMGYIVTQNILQHINHFTLASWRASM